MSCKIYDVKDYSVFDTMPEIPKELWDKAKYSMKKYLFLYPKKKDKREYVCSFCGNRGVAERYAAFPQDLGESKIFFADHNEKVECPFCGVSCIAKRAGISRSQLNEYREFCFFVPLSFNDVWIRTFTVKRIYSIYASDNDKYELIDYPSYECDEIDRFHLTPGKGDQWRSWNWNGKTFGWLSEFMEPFGNYSGCFYTVSTFQTFCSVPIQDTFLKYSGFANFKSLYPYFCNIFQYYGYYSRYPEIEMLVKASYVGGKHLVYDLLKGEKNKRIINWGAKSYKELFNISPEEMKLWISEGGHLGDFKCVRRFGKFTKEHIEANNLIGEFFKKRNFREQQKMISRCKRYGISFLKFFRYLHKVEEDNPGCSRCPSPDVYITWSDYIDNAEELKLDLKDPVVFMPKNLFAAHDSAFRNAELVRAQNLERKSSELYQKLLKKYGFEDDNYIIVVPHCVEDIVNEGKAMHHCVGGYAERHFNGSTVILFLREKERIAKPFVTIEMNGVAVRQARAACNASPTFEAKKFIDKWVAYLKEPKRKKTVKESEVRAS